MALNAVPSGVGHPEQPLPDVRRADARSAQIGSPDGIAHRFQINSYSGEPFGVDNGAFPAWQNDTPWPEKAFLKMIDRVMVLGRQPYLCVLPDIVGGGLKSRDMSMAWLEKLPTGLPWYFAVQDRMTFREVEHVFRDSRITGIFLGGTDAFKATARQWALDSKKFGKRFHYGRAGTMRKVVHAVHSGADSIDSAFPLWTNDRFDRFIEVVTKGHPQQDWVYQNGEVY